MKSLEELNSLREKLRADMQIREKSHSITVSVSMGTCGIAAGARDTMMALLEEINKQNLKDVALTQTGCVGTCQQEPLVEIKKGADIVTYINIDREKAREIVRRHLVEGKVIKQWTILDQ